MAPANGQWQFDPLLCIGATGIQASEPSVALCKNNGRKHAQTDLGRGIDRGTDSGRTRRGAIADRDQVQPRGGDQYAEGAGGREVQGTGREIHRGKVKVEVYPNSQLYKDKEELEALQLGAVQMLAPSNSKFGPIGVKEFEVFDLPYILPDLKTLRKVTDGPLGAKLLKLLDSKGMTGLAYWDNGFKQMSANKKLVRRRTTRA
jgi:hypothetical protein